MLQTGKRRALTIALAIIMTFVLASCNGDDNGTSDNARAMRWWNALSAEQMVAALYGDEATAEQTVSAQKMYADLDGDTKELVNMTADELYGTGGFDSVGAWWESLDCRLMRIAAGDGTMADPMSPYCAHYPGSGAAKILSEEAESHVNKVGMALLDLDEPGLFVWENARAMRWWNALSAEQMVAALYGDEATAEQTVSAQKMYADLDGDTKELVNMTADELYGTGGFDSVGAWWESLDCRLMRIAAGDGTMADPMSPYCAHYPGSGAAKILSEEAESHVNKVGMALLDLDEPGFLAPGS